MKLTPETLAFCYELRCEYKWTFKRIARLVGCSENHLSRTIRAKVNAE